MSEKAVMKQQVEDLLRENEALKASVAQKDKEIDLLRSELPGHLIAEEIKAAKSVTFTMFDHMVRMVNSADMHRMDAILTQYKKQVQEETRLEVSRELEVPHDGGRRDLAPLMAKYIDVPEVRELLIDIGNLRRDVHFWLTDSKRNRDKWQMYEREYILPTFKWAEEVKFDLREKVYRNPGMNCVELLVRHLIDRLAPKTETPPKTEFRGITLDQITLEDRALVSDFYRDACHADWCEFDEIMILFVAARSRLDGYEAGKKEASVPRAAVYPATDEQYREMVESSLAFVDAKAEDGTGPYERWRRSVELMRYNRDAPAVFSESHPEPPAGYSYCPHCGDLCGTGQWSEPHTDEACLSSMQGNLQVKTRKELDLLKALREWDAERPSAFAPIPPRDIKLFNDLAKLEIVKPDA